MKNLLNVDATKRFSADKALSHAWFTHQQIFNKLTLPKKHSNAETSPLKNGGFFNFGKHMKQDNHKSLNSQNMLLDAPESEEPKKSDKETNVFSENNLNFFGKKNLRVKSENFYCETSPSEDPNSEKDTNIGSSCYTEGDNTNSSLKNAWSLGSKQKGGDITPSSLKSIGGVFPKKYSRKTEN